MKEKLWTDDENGMAMWNCQNILACNKRFTFSKTVFAQSPNNSASKGNSSTIDNFKFIQQKGNA